MVNNLKSQLSHLVELLQCLSDKDYIKPIKALNNSTIGGHTRHIIEFIKCLLEQYPSGEINYDLRCRNLEIETIKRIAILQIDNIIEHIETEDKPLQHIFTNYHNKQDICTTTYFREIVYNIEHCIHHEALIKVALIELNQCHLTTPNFGVAPSTILATK